MALCSKCAFYSVTIDELQRDFNDIGKETDHFCPMYTDAIPSGIFDGDKSCEFFEERGKKG